ncbi:MAG: hypothetical protein IJY65_05145 [Clostridia bacterium]|nr:hypothetical protein [Clostridia bacterium]
MAEDNELLKKRFIELARRSCSKGVYCFTDFLGLSEQSVFEEARRDFEGAHVTLFGGAAGAERVMARFGSEEELGWCEEFPIVCIKAEPRSKKFADELCHRDFLGALMNLGLERDTLGDIAVIDNIGYIFAKESVAQHIIDSLTRVKHTDLTLSLTDKIPEGELYKTEPIRIQASSERLDGVIAKVYRLSREDAQALFAKKLVFLNGARVESVSLAPNPDDVVSVRGYGRFIYRGFESNTKKGKLNLVVERYI